MHVLEIHLEFAANRCAQTIEKLAYARAIKVVLQITGIELICYIEYRDTDSRPVRIEFGNGEAFGHLSIQRDESREASRLIARADEIQPLVHVREREPGSNLQRWRNIDIVTRLPPAEG